MKGWWGGVGWGVGWGGVGWGGVGLRIFLGVEYSDSSHTQCLLLRLQAFAYAQTV